MPRIVTPAGYAKLVAEDRERASHFAALLASGDRTNAGHCVAEAAEEVRDYCMGMASPLARNLANVQAISNIDKVGKRSARHGHQEQAQWCAYLHSKLEGK